jgi:F-type H+-transporting ATPase subunit alpha
MELLKQPLGRPYAMHEQVILLVCANGKKLDFVPINQVKEYKNNLLKYFEEHRPDIIEDLEKSGDLTDGTRKEILETADEFEKENNERLKQELKKKRKILKLD